MRGDAGSLFDAHAARLHAYCWSLLGDAAAASAVTDAYVAATQHPPRGDAVLWMYSLARQACAGRGAFAAQAVPPFGTADPLLHAAGTLRADHREALLLEAGEWLEVPDIAHVLGIAPDTTRQLLTVARNRLERAVLDVLMRGGGTTELITAFEKGRLPRLLADRAPATAPDWLRERVLAACAEALSGDPATRPLPAVTSPSPLVVIAGGAGPAPRGRPARERPRRGLARGLGAVAGIAASVATAVSVLASWPSAKEGVGVSSVTPGTGGSGTAPVADRTASDGTASPTTSTRRLGNGRTGDGIPASPPPQSTEAAPPPAPAPPPPPDGSGSGSASVPGTQPQGPSTPPDRPGTPSGRPATPTAPPAPPTTPPTEQPTTPPTTPSSPPSQEPPAPTPSSNPTPDPG
ncbi:hypothetical protein GCM10009678_21260 [Actinomadura kijaniata]|uniref:RNA polymerase sigma factor n=1 Tax=Actinomadura kijaniata TaxID=46161 RepID=UPI002FE7E39D